MGGAYTHGLFVADLDWRPTWGHVRGLHEVLERWGFARQPQPFYAVTRDDMEEIDEKDASRMPANLMVAYDGLAGAAVDRLLGPSAYDDVSPEDRAIAAVLIHLGVDFKVVRVEGFAPEILAPPMTGETPVAPLSEPNPALPEHLLYPATWTTTPPRTATPDGTGGVWRSAILIDCDHDIPAIGETGDVIPARTFVAELEQALGTALVELGWMP